MFEVQKEATWRERVSKVWAAKAEVREVVKGQTAEGLVIRCRD